MDKPFSSPKIRNITISGKAAAKEKNPSSEAAKLQGIRNITISGKAAAKEKNPSSEAAKLQGIRNITISGKAAAGATTLSRMLSEKIKWKLINPGEMYRQYVKKENIPLEKTSAVSDQYHLDLDGLIKDKLRLENQFIVESWLSGFDAQNIKGVFKVFINCTNDSIRIDRLVNRDKMTIEEAKHHLKVREEENLEKWEKLYHTRDFWNPELYDLVIDTYHFGPTETLDLVLEKIGYRNK